MYAFQSHGDVSDSIFTCRSSFKPFVPPTEQISLQDHIPESVKKEKKKSNGIEYLPGERLLIKLAKTREKEIDIDRVTQSMSRVLTTFR